MHIPPQGFRHAVTLLLTNRARAISEDASPASVGNALRRLADELVALATDMRASREARTWLMDEYSRTIERLRCAFDSAAAKEYARRTFESVGIDIRENEARDLFILYVPEDRLPIAAPLAIALTKRRLSVAFSEYEVATPEELVTGIEGGLRRHGAGIVLDTSAFDRAGLRPHLITDARLRVLTCDGASDVDGLVTWSFSVGRRSSGR
jgi:hypothetical protein